MKHFIRWMFLAAMVGTLLANVTTATAQPAPGGGDRPNFDPEQMRARMMERYRERLEVKSDDEWKILEERITKVTEARRDVGFGGMGRGAFGGGRPGGRGGGGNDGAQAQRPNRAFGGSSSPEAEELQKALEAKAAPEEIKAKLAKYRDARKAKQANLTKAQDELRKVLSVRQEAVAVMDGLLD
ncbi:MAG: hypothetical protein JNK85_13165 [Verrucomicrobiales bacterium]|nr:hypothetical protein [Verrucomicrobiales bacterium]